MKKVLCCIALICFSGCDDTSSNAGIRDGESLLSIDASSQSVDGAGFIDGFLTPPHDANPSPLSDSTPNEISDSRPPTADGGEPFEEHTLTPEAPANSRELFDSAEVADDCTLPQIVYPEDGTVFPGNIEGVAFQWTDETTLARLRLSAGELAGNWYGSGASMIPSGEALSRLRQRSVNGATITVHVSTLLADGRRCDSPPISVRYDRSPLQGAIYYWSTSDVGIMRLAAGEDAPEPFLTQATAPMIACPACHALSRDGQRIAFTRTTFPPFGELATSDINSPDTLLYDPTGVIGYFPSFAPDSRRIVAGNGGQLVISEAGTGAEIERLPLAPMTVGGSPDWSWQGDRIVAAVGPSGLENILVDAGLNMGSIVQWHRVDDLWSMPDVLLEQEDPWWYDRPAFSPDGSVIVFNRHGPDPNDDDMKNPNTELWLLDSNGGPAVALTAANKAPMLGNSWAKWSPHSGGGRMWVAFSSLRDYGRILQNEGADGATPQIWVTGVDPNALPGEDPSSPAFWLPHQSTNSGNHIPYWSVYEKQ